MRLNGDLLVLSLAADLLGTPTALPPVVILDEDHGHTLVDIAVPGSPSPICGRSS